MPRLDLARLHQTRETSRTVGWCGISSCRTSTPLEATPLAVDGILYFSGTFGKTSAVDARIGRELWEFDPDLARYYPREVRRKHGRPSRRRLLEEQVLRGDQ